MRILQLKINLFLEWSCCAGVLRIRDVIKPEGFNRWGKIYF